MDLVFIFGKKFPVRVSRKSGSIGKQGFTLIEAVIALGVFGFAITILLGLFLRSNSQLREAEDRAQVVTIMPTLNAKLVEVGWDRATNQGRDGVVELTAAGPFTLVANADASHVTLPDGDFALAEGEQYYQLAVTRYDRPGLRYGTDVRGVMVLKVHVEWPYRLPGSADGGFIETRPEDRNRFEFISTVRP